MKEIELKIQELPENLKKEVLDYIEFLLEKYKKKKERKFRFRENGLSGIWDIHRLNSSTNHWSGDDVPCGYKHIPILLGQNKKEECKKFLVENIGNLAITDFTLHSIGVILFRYSREDVFEKFVEDVATSSELLSLPVEKYNEVVLARKKLNLDFDDAYQYAVAKHYGLKIVTMDKDFAKVTGVEVIFM